MRSRPFLLFALAGLAVAAQADYIPTRIVWRTWNVSSSEDRFMGAKYGDHYNLRNLFDRDPKTAWVFEQVKTDSPDDYWSGKYAISIENKRGVVVDSVRLVGGYAKSPEVFRRNNRVRKIEIYGQHPGDWQYTRIAQAELRDTDTWQEIKIPRRKYGGIRLVAKSFYPGQDHDFALSELMLTRDGRDVMNPLPKALLSTKGDECGCGISYAVIDPKSRVLGRTAFETFPDSFLSPDGRYCVAVLPNETRTVGSVIELETGVVKKTLRVRGVYGSVLWLGERTFRLSNDGPNPPKPLTFRF